MILINHTNGRIIADPIKIASGAFDLLFGLLNPALPRALILRTRFGVHTLMMKVPICVIVVDSKMRVVKVSKKMLPNRFLFWNPRYSTVIEIQSNKEIPVKTGDLLGLKD